MTLTAKRVVRTGTVVGVVLLGWHLMSSERSAPVAEVSPPSIDVPAAVSSSPSKECLPHTETSVRTTNADSATARLTFSGDPGLLARNQHMDQEPAPTHVSFKAIAAEMGDYFPLMDQPPATKGEERVYHHYDEKKNAMLHLEGDRGDLGVIHLTLFDRVKAPEERMETQAEMVRRFLSGAFKDGPRSLSAEVEAFVSGANASGKGQRRQSWSVGDNVLSVSTVGGYGMVTMTVSATESGTESS